MKLARSLAKLLRVTGFALALTVFTGAVWAQQPHQEQCLISLIGTSGGQCSFQRVPAGKVLVIQEFDAEGYLVPGLKPVQIHVDVGLIYHVFTATFMGSGYFDYYATHQETHLYVEAGRTPVCEVTLSAVSSDDLYYFCHLSGLLENAP